MNDIYDSIKKIHLAFFFAWSDTKARFKRSVLGPFWLVLNTAMSILGLSYLWSAILKINYADFLPSLAAGLIVWQLIAGCLTEAPGIFTRNASLIRNIPLPLGFFGLQLVFKQLVNFFHNLLLLVIILYLFPSHGSLLIFLQILAGFMLLVGNLLWMVLFIGIVGARYRDIETFIAALMPTLFFLTPVIYKPNNLGAIQHIAWLNPLTYLITLVRDPLLGSPVPGFVWLNTLIALVIGWLLTLLLISKKYQRLPFWV